MNNIIFLHIATIGNYQHVVDEIFSYIEKSKNKFTSIFVNIAGNLDVVIPNISTIKIFSKRSNLEEFEFTTLNKLKDFADSCTEETNILYIHTKGVTAANNLCISDWRQYMLYFNIEQSHNALQALLLHDAVGVDLVEEPVKHFSGNIWWSKSSYISKLPYPKNIPCVISERHKCEFWICINKDGKFKSLHNSNINVYQRHLHRFTSDKYENLD